MFHFFSKKNFLIDSLHGFVDIHNHLLPAIDDGAETCEEAIELVKGFSEFGVANFVATPHIMHNYYPNTPQSITDALGELHRGLLEHDLKDIAVDAAAEHMIDDNFENLLEQGAVMPLRKEFLLVEMSYLQPPINFDEAIIKTASSGFYPILAHPERYNFLHQRFAKYTQYKEAGILFQLNLLSLGNFYGNGVPKIAAKLLEEGLIDFVASDVHNKNQLQALKELRISKKMLRMVLPIIDKTIVTFY